MRKDRGCGRLSIVALVLTFSIFVPTDIILLSFSFGIVEIYTPVGETVLDPYRLPDIILKDELASLKGEISLDSTVSWHYGRARAATAT